MVSDGDHAAVVALASAVLLVVLVLGRVTTSMLWNLKEQKQMIDAGFERRLVPTAWRETWVKPQEAEAAK
jgi:sulfite exporter TauE/SafE